MRLVHDTHPRCSGNCGSQISGRGYGVLVARVGRGINHLCFFFYPDLALGDFASLATTKGPTVEFHK